MGDCKHLCGWGKKRIESDFDQLALIVERPRFICRNCGRATADSATVCKPRPLPRTERSDREERPRGRRRRHERFKRLKKALKKDLRRRVKLIRRQLLEQLDADLEQLGADLSRQPSEPRT